MFIKFLGLILATISPAFCYWYQDCNSNFEINYLHVSGCKGTPCAFHIGKQYDFEINMTATKNLTSIKEEVEIMMINIHNPIKVSPGPCSESRPCPLEEGGDASFKANFVVPEWMPAFPGQLVWKLQNERDEPILCININIETCQNDKECKTITDEAESKQDN